MMSSVWLKAKPKHPNPGRLAKAAWPGAVALSLSLSLCSVSPPFLPSPLSLSQKAKLSSAKPSRLGASVFRPDVCYPILG